MRSASDSPPLRVGTPVRTRRPRRLSWLVILPAAAGLSFGVAWATGLRPETLWAQSPWGGPRVVYPTLLVDEGTVPVFLVESGALESANNAVVKCQVEALLGAVGGGGGMGGPGGGGGGRTGGGGGGGGAGGRTGGGGGGGAGGGGMAGGGMTGGGMAGGGMTGGSGGMAGATGAGGAAGTGAAGAGGAGATGTMGAAGMAMGGTRVSKPTIRSFSYNVPRHMPLRAATGMMTQTTTRAAAPMAGGMGGGMEMGELAGSTRILSILPEGTRVKAGELVCTLDSAAFRDELQEQKIRTAQAESWVQQAEKILEVSQIELREYSEGIFPQDRLLCDQYIAACRTQLTQAKLDMEWVTNASKSGLATHSQLQASGYALQRAEIALREAEGMKYRLENFARLRIIRELEAKIESVRSDLLAQQAALQIEKDRQERLELNIARCELHAPRDGILVYVNETNGWGRVETQIQEGTTVREGQPIFQVPDPTKMLVKAKINESRIGQVHPGQPTVIRVDAYPDRPLQGVVSEVTAIPSPSAGPMSDVKIYEAIIHVDRGFEGLKPGMSAEVSFFIDSHPDVTRVPRQAIHRDGDRSFAAVATRDSLGYQWRAIEVGLVGQIHAEVLSGLKPGDRVIAEPWVLPRPDAAATLPATRTAALDVTDHRS